MVEARELLALFGGPGVAGPLLVGARSFGLLATAPLTGCAAVPWRLRLGLALLLGVAAGAAPAAAGATLSPSPSAAVAAVALEGLLGAAMGFAAALVLEGARLGGALLDRPAELDGLRAPDPEDAAPAGPVERLALLLALGAFLAADGHHALVRAVAGSVNLIPPGTWGLTAAPGAAVADVLVRAGASVFATGLRVALPAAFLLFLFDVALAVVGRACPSLEPALRSGGLRSLAASAAAVGAVLLAAPLLAGLVEEAVGAAGPALGGW